MTDIIIVIVFIMLMLFAAPALVILIGNKAKTASLYRNLERERIYRDTDELRRG
jgi:hypothetical protein